MSSFPRTYQPVYLIAQSFGKAEHRELSRYLNEKFRSKTSTVYISVGSLGNSLNGDIVHRGGNISEGARGLSRIAALFLTGQPLFTGHTEDEKRYTDLRDKMLEHCRDYPSFGQAVWENLRILARGFTGNPVSSS